MPEVSSDAPQPLLKRVFVGAVVVTDWIPLPQGGQTRGFCGRCHIIPVEQALGFKVNAHDSNWLVVIEGESTTVVIPGCKVAQIFEGSDVTSSDYHLVP